MKKVKNIKILGRVALEKLLPEESKKHVVIYYTNSEYPEYPFVKNHAINSLHMPIEDIDHYEFKYVRPIVAEDVQRFLDFSDGYNELVVACQAGVSRSSATAYLIGAKKWGPIAALELLQPAYHYPNRLIVYIGSKLLGNNDIWQKYIDWMKNWCGLDPSQSHGWPKIEMVEKMGFDKVPKKE